MRIQGSVRQDVCAIRVDAVARQVDDEALVLLRKLVVVEVTPSKRCGYPQFRRLYAWSNIKEGVDGAGKPNLSQGGDLRMGGGLARSETKVR